MWDSYEATSTFVVRVMGFFWDLKTLHKQFKNTGFVCHVSFFPLQKFQMTALHPVGIQHMITLFMRGGQGGLYLFLVFLSTFGLNYLIIHNIYTIFTGFFDKCMNDRKILLLCSYNQHNGHQRNLNWFKPTVFWLQAKYLRPADVLMVIAGSWGIKTVTLWPWDLYSHKEAHIPDFWNV